MGLAVDRVIRPRSERLLARPNMVRCEYVIDTATEHGFGYAWRVLPTEEDAIALCEWLDLAPDDELARALLESVP